MCAPDNDLPHMLKHPTCERMIVLLFSITTALLCGAAFCILRVSSPSGSFPHPLSEKQETYYVKAMQNGDTHAKEKLIEHNLRLVAHIVKKYYSVNADTDDLISIGTIGLIKGVSTFDPDKKVRLSTYISRCIENEILMYFRTSKKLSYEVSLEEPMEQDGDGNALAWMDLLSCNDDALDAVERSDQYQLLTQALTRLTAREREIISLRYGLDGHLPLTQREVAALHHISRSYVSRIESKALKKMRMHLTQPE